MKQIRRDDFYLNQTLRRQLKMEKGEVKKHQEESRKKNLDIRLLPVNSEDRV